MNDRLNTTPQNWTNLISGVCFLLLIAVLVYVMLTNGNLSPLGYQIAKFLMAVSAGLVMTLIGGQFKIFGRFAGLVVSGIGGPAIFFVVLFLMPFPTPTPTSDYQIYGHAQNHAMVAIGKTNLTFHTDPPVNVQTDTLGAFSLSVSSSAPRKEIRVEAEGYRDTSVSLTAHGLTVVLRKVSLTDIFEISQAKQALSSLASEVFSRFQDEFTGGIKSGGQTTGDSPGEWTTARAILVAILARKIGDDQNAPSAEQIGKAIRWLVGTHNGIRRDEAAWGDIGYKASVHSKTFYPGCVESTSWAIMALREALASDIFANGSSFRSQISAALDGAVRWLLDSAQPGGGWGSFRSDELGSRTYTTCISIVALSRIVKDSIHFCSGIPLSDIRQAIDAAVHWLHDNIRGVGWCANRSESGIGNAPSTAQALYALYCAQRIQIRAHTGMDVNDQLAIFPRDSLPLSDWTECLTWQNHGLNQVHRVWYWLPWTMAIAGCTPNTELLRKAKRELDTNWMREFSALPPWRLTLAAFGIALYMENLSEYAVIG